MHSFVRDVVQIRAFNPTKGENLKGIVYWDVVYVENRQQLAGDYTNFIFWRFVDIEALMKRMVLPDPIGKVSNIECHIASGLIMQNGQKALSRMRCIKLAENQIEPFIDGWFSLVEMYICEWQPKMDAALEKAKVLAESHANDVFQQAVQAALATSPLDAVAATGETLQEKVGAALRQLKEAKEQISLF